MQANNNIDKGKAFDWGRSSKDYAKYRNIYPDEFYQKILDLSLCTSGQSVLDLGTGTGELPRNLYNHGAKFVGIDISKQQIAEARKLSLLQDMDIEYFVVAAEDTAFPDCSFNVVTACQCFIYFNQEILFPKIHRQLKENGHFCILWMGWLPFEDDIAQQSESLVLKYNPAWTGAGFQRNVPVIPKTALPYFEEEHALSYDIKIPFSRQSWHGRMIACRGIGASSLPQETIRNFEEDHQSYLMTVPETFEVLHNVTLLNLKKR